MSRLSRGRLVLAGSVLAVIFTVLLLISRRSPSAVLPVRSAVVELKRPSQIAANIDLYSAPVPQPPPPVAKMVRDSASRSDDTGTEDWAVVSAIYRDYEAAERRARSFASQWRSTKPKVFPPRGEGAKYMVVLGSGLTLPAAERLRDEARDAGLPEDTYVTRIFKSSPDDASGKIVKRN